MPPQPAFACVVPFTGDASNSSQIEAVASATPLCEFPYVSSAAGPCAGTFASAKGSSHDVAVAILAVCCGVALLRAAFRLCVDIRGVELHSKKPKIVRGPSGRSSRTAGSSGGSRTTDAGAQHPSVRRLSGVSTASWRGANRVESRKAATTAAQGPEAAAGNACACKRADGSVRWCPKSCCGWWLWRRLDARVHMLVLCALCATLVGSVDFLSFGDVFPLGLSLAMMAATFTLLLCAISAVLWEWRRVARAGSTRRMRGDSMRRMLSRRTGATLAVRQLCCCCCAGGSRSRVMPIHGIVASVAARCSWYSRVGLATGVAMGSLHALLLALQYEAVPHDVHVALAGVPGATAPASQSSVAALGDVGGFVVGLRGWGLVLLGMAFLVGATSAVTLGVTVFKLVERTSATGDVLAGGWSMRMKKAVSERILRIRSWRRSPRSLTAGALPVPLHQDAPSPGRDSQSTSPPQHMPPRSVSFQQQGSPVLPRPRGHQASPLSRRLDMDHGAAFRAPPVMRRLASTDEADFKRMQKPPPVQRRRASDVPKSPRSAIAGVGYFSGQVVCGPASHATHADSMSGSRASIPETDAPRMSLPATLRSRQGSQGRKSQSPACMSRQSSTSSAGRCDSQLSLPGSTPRVDDVNGSPRLVVVPEAAGPPAVAAAAAVGKQQLDASANSLASAAYSPAATVQHVSGLGLLGESRSSLPGKPATHVGASTTPTRAVSGCQPSPEEAKALLKGNSVRGTTLLNLGEGGGGLDGGSTTPSTRLPPKVLGMVDSALGRASSSDDDDDDDDDGKDGFDVDAASRAPKVTGGVVQDSPRSHPTSPTSVAATHWRTRGSHGHTHAALHTPRTAGRNTPAASGRRSSILSMFGAGRRRASGASVATVATLTAAGSAVDVVRAPRAGKAGGKPPRPTDGVMRTPMHGASMASIQGRTPRGRGTPSLHVGMSAASLRPVHTGLRRGGIKGRNAGGDLACCGLMSAAGMKIVASTAVMAAVCLLQSVAFFLVAIPLLLEAHGGSSCTYAVAVPSVAAGDRLLWYAHALGVAALMWLFPRKRPPHASRRTAKSISWAQWVCRPVAGCRLRRHRGSVGQDPDAPVPAVPPSPLFAQVEVAQSPARSMSSTARPTATE